MATLLIGQSSSTCSACGKGADPLEEGHYTILDWSASGDPGCGEIFWDMAPTNPLLTPAVETLRPDLPLNTDYRNPFVAPESYGD